MGSINQRGGKLFLDFRYLGKRCREYTKLPDTPANRKRAKKILEHIEAEITLGRFDYNKYFPGSKLGEQFKNHNKRITQQGAKTPLFKVFADQWYDETRPQWRTSHAKNVRQTLNRYLLSAFGDYLVDQVSKADLLTFRATLSKPDHKRTKALSPSRINHVMTPLRMILNEAADRYELTTPWRNIKPIKVPRTDVEPFDLTEVPQIIKYVRADFRYYYCVRFFAGLRTAEIDGLKWQYVDFKRRQILIRETIVEGRTEYTKNDGSFREVDMSQLVFDALTAQKKLTGTLDYVFCNKNGGPLRHHTVTKHVWHPLLRHLGLKKRRPYQTRHTTATLWLAAGENPEWIARQMGHTSTEMLFKVYSRFVPNLTRQDGSAFEKLLSNQFTTETNDN